MKTPFQRGGIIVAIAVSGLAAVPPLAAADTGSAGTWYVGTDAGVALQQQVGGVKVNGYPAQLVSTGPTIFRFDPGERADLKVGYNITENWAVELEGGESDNGISTTPHAIATPLPVPFGHPTAPFDYGHLWQAPLLLSGIYKYSFTDKWQGYGGIGVGAVVSDLRLSNAYDRTDRADCRFGYQLQLGVKYLISSRWECALEYKFLGTTGHEWNFGSDVGDVKTDATMSHSILLSVAYKF
jgi:opacity protein-like surface antigen